jgi:8-oxo-dGTP pyrophosphatase MutT (NUDIX family)
MSTDGVIIMSGHKTFTEEPSMGAGVIPLAINNGELLFLFQKTFSGRKTGYLIDFGGGLGDGEDYRATAMREFVEETETMYLTYDLEAAQRSEDRVMRQLALVDEIFEHTLSVHPHWWLRRDSDGGKKPKDWRTYFIKFPFRNVQPLNNEWQSDSSGRFRKRRELVWIPADELLDIYAGSPDNLWKRVRQLENVETLIRDIQSSLLPS